MAQTPNRTQKHRQSQQRSFPNPIIQPIEGDDFAVKYAELLTKFEKLCAQRGITTVPPVTCRRIGPSGNKLRQQLGSHVIAWVNCQELGGSYSSYPELYADEKQAQANVLAKIVEALSVEESVTWDSSKQFPLQPPGAQSVAPEANHNLANEIKHEPILPSDHLGLPLNKIGLKECYVVQVVLGGGIFIMLHGEQQRKWERLKYEYDPASPAEQIEFGRWYVVESYKGPGLGKMYERARILCNLPSGASIAYFADSGHEEIVWPNQIFEIQNYDEVNAIRPQAVKVLIPNLRYPPNCPMPIRFNADETFLVVPSDVDQRPPRVQLISKDTGMPFKLMPTTTDEVINGGC
ncbi:hypothetical protein BIW11_09759 [Tropilaelaps mercedesae]|uniref:Uncharacterized protein n=1 Tax=Tropilaelaps mercedesae TaxID=418985 RepID=A0A1V9XIN3_9ACAR|nr:hypothetical protein BIW11_09759 [Tropilaelaps mercedesae]